MRSTNRLPVALSVPPLVFRHSTPWRTVRSATLLVGSTPSWRTNVHNRRSWVNNARQVAAVLAQRKRPVTLSITHNLASQLEAVEDVGEPGEPAPDHHVAG